MRADEIASAIGRSHSAAHDHVVRLVARGTVVRERVIEGRGTGRGSSHYSYRLAPAVPTPAPVPVQLYIPRPSELPELMSSRAVMDLAEKLIALNNFVASVSDPEAHIDRLDDAMHDLLERIAEHRDEFVVHRK